MSSTLRVAVVGATGAVGTELLGLLATRGFPVGDLRLHASERSEGTTIRLHDRDIHVRKLEESSFYGVNVAFFSAGATRSKEFVPAALKSGALVVDNSSAFRMDEGVPLVIPEINGELIKKHHRLYPVANCTAIVVCMAVAPLRALGKIERLIVSTYQSASGGGAQMMRRLTDETKAALEGETPIAEFPYAFNLFNHNTPINEHGYNEEEWKVVQETQKMLDAPDLRINVTCVRVPVLRAHSASITVEFEGVAPSADDVREALRVSKGVRLVDDRQNNRFPTPLDASGQDDVLVGRIRQDVSNPNALCLFACGDQLRKGAALNAVQIAERWLGC